MPLRWILRAYLAACLHPSGLASRAFGRARGTEVERDRRGGRPGEAPGAARARQLLKPLAFQKTENRKPRTETHVLLLLAALLLMLPERGAAQVAPVPFQVEDAARAEAARALQPAPGLASNSVSVLAARGDALWPGPHLHLTTDGGRTWQRPAADSLRPGGRNLLFALDLDGGAVLAGLGYGSCAATCYAGGFLVSTDGGQAFAYRPPPLDAVTDTVVAYGASRLPALPIVQPAASPPYDVDADPRAGTLWTASGYAGHRVSTDGGRTWQRVVLPPDSLAEIRPEEVYDFRLAPPTLAGGDSNYVAYSVLVDEAGTVWAGTAGGLNRSRAEAARAAAHVRAWQRFDHATTGGGIPGDQIVALAEQPAPGRNPVWLAGWPVGPGQRYGVAVTRDGGQSFEALLLDARIQDLAFRNETVYAVGVGGLFILDADGSVRRRVTDFPAPGAPAPSSLRALAVATTRRALWVGTTAGLYRSTDEGRTWQVFRARPRLREGEATYAYPNPFSPVASSVGHVSFAVEVDRPREVDVRIYDFGMNLVRRLSGPCAADGACQIRWNGTDAAGRQVANGVYFYTADTGRRLLRGKIVVLE